MIDKTLAENNELLAIFASSIATARRNMEANQYNDKDGLSEHPTLNRKQGTMN